MIFEFDDNITMNVPDNQIVGTKIHESRDWVDGKLLSHHKPEGIEEFKKRRDLLLAELVDALAIIDYIERKSEKSPAQLIYEQIWASDHPSSWEEALPEHRATAERIAERGYKLVKEFDDGF